MKYVYQPIDSEKENEVYYHFDNVKRDFPNSKVVIYEASEIEDPIFMDFQRTVIKLVHDEIPENPFDDWDTEYPLMSDIEDYSRGDIDSYLLDFLNFEVVKNNLVSLLKMTDYTLEEFRDDYPLDVYNDDERIEILIDILENWLIDDIKHRAVFCREFEIKHYHDTSRGFTKGDASEVFICWTPEFEEATGLTYDKATVRDMKSSFKLFTQWAWGDVYGFRVEDEEGNILDGCHGFYGTDWKNNGILDHIMDEINDKSREEVLEIIENAEIEYNY